MTEILLFHHAQGLTTGVRAKRWKNVPRPLSWPVRRIS